MLDRDPKFLGNIWQQIFSALKVALRFTTAWHPQADGQSERTNQEYSIALRFAADDPRFKDWEAALPALTMAFNATPNASTGKTPNEIVYGFEPFCTLPSDIVDPAACRVINQMEARDAVQYAQDVMKERYDRNHLPLQLRAGDRVYFNLWKGYKIKSLLCQKLAQRRVGPFQSLKAYPNTYELDLPKAWKIPPVISIEHLEPAPPGLDPYQRPIDNGEAVEPVEQDGDTEEWKSWEIDLLIDKRMVRRGQKKMIQYLVRWKGFGPAYDEWYDVDLLDNAADLVQQFETAHQ